MGIEITQTCTNLGADYCEEWSYSGRSDTFQVTIPMLEAMGLITLWMLVAFLVASIFKKFA